MFTADALGDHTKVTRLQKSYFSKYFLSIYSLMIGFDSGLTGLCFFPKGLASGMNMMQYDLIIISLQPPKSN